MWKKLKNDFFSDVTVGEIIALITAIFGAGFGGKIIEYFREQKKEKENSPWEKLQKFNDFSNEQAEIWKTRAMEFENKYYDIYSKNLEFLEVINKLTRNIADLEDEISDKSEDIDNYKSKIKELEVQVKFMQDNVYRPKEKNKEE